MLRSRIKWNEEGEKNTKYFLNLENNKRKKNSMRKIFKSKNQLISNPKEIMNELEKFYTNLYHKDNEQTLQQIKITFLENNNIQKLNEE